MLIIKLCMLNTQRSPTGSIRAGNGESYSDPMMMDSGLGWSHYGRTRRINQIATIIVTVNMIVTRMFVYCVTINNVAKSQITLRTNVTATTIITITVSHPNYH
ncbi:hypothetical protein RIR_jg23715.t1 [Rhizophagus irregularis DAOM 181602=DAOM 197198]|nr:hypothetical protein RIR_jg23715.t1 [Rhizophagus irregularis DAOM 181602=DAOM 197198]